MSEFDISVNNFREYKDAVSYILSIPRFSGKSSFEETVSFFEFLNIDVTASKNIHVAGTNGKGSVCAYLTSIHKAMGKTVGTFTSPHLVDIRERVSINGEMISEEAFLDGCNIIMKKLQEFRHKEAFANYHPSFFEFMFFLGAVYFAEVCPDVIIWETGLGGRLDATNILKKKDVTIITEIGLDHMEYLGDTVEAIAGEKAGILRSGVPVVFADRGGAAKSVIERRAEELACPVYPVVAPECNNSLYFNKGIAFSYFSRYYNNVMFEINTGAVYQAENASMALKAVELLYSESELSCEIMQKGLADMVWPGRMEEVAPGIFLDGAHNEDGVKAFIDSVGRDGCEGNRLLLFSAVTDKQVAKMIGIIKDSGLFSMVGTAAINNSRGTSREDLEQFMSIIPKTIIADSVEDAFRALYELKGEEDYLYVCGSLYLIGELKAGIVNGDYYD